MDSQKNTVLNMYPSEAQQNNIMLLVEELDGEDFAILMENMADFILSNIDRLKQSGHDDDDKLLLKRKFCRIANMLYSESESLKEHI